MKPYLLLVLIVSLASCSKNDAVPAVTEPEGTRLVKLLVMDSTLFTPYDSSMYRFEYDQTGRLNKLTYLAFDPAVWRMSAHYTYSFSYSGGGESPWQVLINYQPPTGNLEYTMEHQLYYDAQQKLLRDSSSHLFTRPGADTIYSNSKYFYQPDGYLDSTYTYNWAGSSAFESFVPQLKEASGNISSETSFFGNKVTYEMLYDNRPNPLYTVSPVKVPYLINNTWPCFIRNISPQKNNLVKSTERRYDASGTTVLSEIVTNYYIRYRADGYPVEMRTVSTPSHEKDKLKYLFIYGK